ncbi:MAG: class I SAM-dependent methyltransferase [Ignavibacteria bacterium]|nr:class I SAM-dependent methyltransferase [Ignavibacteria bacterium]
MEYEKIYNQGVLKLRTPERLERLEVPRVVASCLEGNNFSSVLDIGTGSGVFAEAFFHSGLRVSGIDVNPEMIEFSQKLLPQCTFELGKAEDLSAGDQSFDMVFMGLVFHEVTDEAKTLQGAYRVCGIRTAILEWPYKDEELGPPLLHRVQPGRIQELAIAAGFKNIQIVELEKLILYLLNK